MAFDLFIDLSEIFHPLDSALDQHLVKVKRQQNPQK